MFLAFERKCGILELGQLEDHNEDPGVVLRTDEGVEIFLPLEREEVQAIGKAEMLFKNLKLTIKMEIEG